MYDDTNPASDYATGDLAAPSRDEIERVVDRFNQADNSYRADVLFGRYGDYLIRVFEVEHARRDISPQAFAEYRSFEWLDEFEEWADARLDFWISGHLAA